MCLMLCAPLDWQYAELPSSASYALFILFLLLKVLEISLKSAREGASCIMAAIEINASLLVQKWKFKDLVTGQRHFFVAVVRMNKALSFEKYIKRNTPPDKAFHRRILYIIPRQSFNVKENIFTTPIGFFFLFRNNLASSYIAANQSEDGST